MIYLYKFFSHKKTIQNKKDIFSIGLFLLLVFSLIMAASLVIQSRVTSVKPFGEKHFLLNKKPIKETNNSVNQTPTPTPKFVIQQKINGNHKKVFEFTYVGLDHIIRWKDYLFYTYPYGVNGMHVIYQHDLLTGETQQLFTLKNEEFMMSDLLILNDTLYFSLVAYLREGESYWIDLTSETKTVNKLANKSGSIVKIKDHYFFIKSEGDACWGRSDYYLLNLQTKKLTPIADTNIGCGGGDEYYGINNNDEMVLASHTSFPDTDGYPWPIPQVYTQIISIPLSSPQMRNEVIPSSMMPKNISRIKYDVENDRLILIGDSIHIYSFAQRQLQKIVDLPAEWLEFKQVVILTDWKENNNNFCMLKSDDNGKRKMSFIVDIDQKSIKSFEGCPALDAGGRSKTAEEVFNDLKLPSNYNLVEE